MPIADDSVRVFASAAARDSFITSPRVGQACILLDSGSYLIYYGKSLGWTPPWNLPWGEAATILCTSTHVSDSNTSAQPTLFSDLSVNWTPIVGRKYRFNFWANIVGGVNGDLTEAIVQYHTDAGLADTGWGASSKGVSISTTATMAGTSPDPVYTSREAVVDFTTLGAHGYWTMGCIEVTGTGGAIANGTNFSIMDIGPLANPIIT